MKPNRTKAPPTLAATAHRHLAYGWWSLLLFLSFGLILEGLHGFKADLYLNVSHEMRRLMWTLAHAHGTLLSLVNIAFAFTVLHLDSWGEPPRQLASRCLAGATALLPGGFFLGGLILHGADPGLGIVLVPIGAVLLGVAAYVTARAISDAKPNMTP